MNEFSGTSDGKRYRPIVELGRGGMAEVVLAAVEGQAGFNKLVVLKKAKREFCQEPDFVAMFLDEGRLAGRLNHPNVVQTYEVGQLDDELFIAMEYLEGQPLNRARGTPRANTLMPLPLQIHVLCGVLAGLHHAHELCDYDGTPLNVVHRDISPHNIFVTYDGQVKVVDFGIAKAAGASVQTRLGAIKGKVSYMAPEQARGGAVDRRADIYVVGILLWEAIAGRRIWRDIPDAGIIFQLTQGTPPSLREAAPQVDPALEAIVLRAMATDPDDRYPTALDMQAALEDYAGRLARVSARDLGRFVTDQFGSERPRVKSIIEERLSDLRMGSAVDSIRSLPSLMGSVDVASSSQRGNLARESPSSLPVATQSSPVSPTPFNQILPTSPGVPVPRIAPTLPSGPSPLAGGAALAVTELAPPPSVPTPTAPAPRSLLLPLLLVGGVVLGSVGGVLVARRGQTATTAPSIPTTPAAPVSTAVMTTTVATTAAPPTNAPTEPASAVPPAVASGPGSAASVTSSPSVAARLPSVATAVRPPPPTKTATKTEPPPPPPVGTDVGTIRDRH